MDIQISAAIVSFILFSIFVYLKRKKIETQKILFPLLYFSMYRTTFGIRCMEAFATKFRKPLKIIGYLGIFLCFLGMITISFLLVQNIYILFTKPEAKPGVGLVLPFNVPWAFYVPFFYWIISIIIIAIVHEFSHGILAQTHNLKIKSSGFAFLGILLPVIPAAFVEPDEKELKKKPHNQQLSVFAAGPFSNILLGALLLFIVVPLVHGAIESKGVKITGYVDHTQKFPAELAGINPGEIILQMDETQIKSINDLERVMSQKKPGDKVQIATDKKTYNLVLAKNPEKENLSYLGVKLQNNFPLAIIWLMDLLWWLITLSFGIGLFNLLPIGPLDGGRMLQLVMHKIFNKEKGEKYWKYIGIFFLMVVFVNILFSFIK